MLNCPALQFYGINFLSFKRDIYDTIVRVDAPSKALSVTKSVRKYDQRSVECLIILQSLRISAWNFVSGLK